MKLNKDSLLRAKTNAKANIRIIFLMSSQERRDELQRRSPKLKLPEDEIEVLRLLIFSVLDSAIPDLWS